MAINRISALRQTFRKAASDGEISDGEVASAIRQAGRNTLTSTERKELARQLSVRAATFGATAKTRLSRFVTAASKPADNADPSVMNHDRGALHYRGTRGALYRNGISARDVVQGHAGDCYFVSTLSAAAKQRPSLITNAITKKADGSFVVRFYARGADGKASPVYIPVDRELARNRAGTHYARSSSSRELWVSVLEKAYAKWKGGYEKIGNGGAPTDAMFALSGKDGSYRPTADAGASATFSQLRSALQQKQLVVAGTRSGPQYKGTGIVQSHAYTVLGVTEKDGVQRVLLRNPWGRTEPGQRGGDGVFALSLSKFMKLFPDLFQSA